MNKITSIFLRYLILVAVAIPNLHIFYAIFTPLTIYPVYFLLSIFFETTLSSTTIILEQVSIQIIPACIAGAAYYLLLILNLSTPEIRFQKRIKLIIISFLAFLILNILRIFSLSILALQNINLFNAVHMFFWYFISIFFVAAIWFTQVKIYKIKSIPFYTDIKNLIK